MLKESINVTIKSNSQKIIASLKCAMTITGYWMLDKQTYSDLEIELLPNYGTILPLSHIILIKNQRLFRESEDRLLKFT